LHDPLLIKGNVFYPSRKNPEYGRSFHHRDGSIYPRLIHSWSHQLIYEKYRFRTGKNSPETRKAGRIMFTDLTMIDSEVKAEFIRSKGTRKISFPGLFMVPASSMRKESLTRSFRDDTAGKRNSLEEKSLEHIFAFLKMAYGIV
jgi:hypothetical protein